MPSSEEILEGLTTIEDIDISKRTLYWRVGLGS
jgi:hypothetical protein